MSEPHFDFQALAASQPSPKWVTTPLEILAAAEKLRKEGKEFDDHIAAIENPTVENVLIPSINFENEVCFAENLITFYQFVSTDKEIRDASTKAEQILEEALIEQYSRIDVFRVYNKLWEQIKNSTEVHPETLRFLEKTVKQYKRNGLDLPEDKREQIKKLKIELSNLSTTFSKNTNEENGFLKFTAEQLEGVPDLVMEQFENISEGGVNYFKVTFKYPDILPVLDHAKNQETRKTALIENLNKVPENAAILDKIIRVRFQIAKLLGYATYSQFVLEDRMAKNQENVLTFLGDLKQKLQPLGRKELSKMVEFKNQDLRERGLPEQDTFYAWDNGFYRNLLLEKEYQVDHQKIAEYFPLDQTIDRMLSFYETLFDIKFVKIENPDADSVWHEDVRKFAVYQNIKYGKPRPQFMGWILFDLHPREGKYTHAAHFGLQSGFVKADGTRQGTYSALVCNFTKPTKTKPSLLKHSEVNTFFHELGHGVHSLLSQTQHARFHGTSVPRDFVECPSQMLEFWTWSSNELKALSSHYETSEPIPDQLVDQLIKSKHVNTGLSNLRQLHFAIFDMSLHTIDDETQIDALDLTKLWNELREDIALISNGGVYNTGYATFGHIAGGYESGYYGYLYSQVFATDIYYSYFKNDPMNVEKGIKYRDIILKNGGSKEILDILQELLGREPNSDAFLQEVLGN